MIRFLYHRSFWTVWFALGLVIGFSLIGFVVVHFTPSTIGFLELIVLSLAAVNLLWLGLGIYLDSIFPRFPHCRLPLYFVDTTIGEFTGCLEDLAQVGVLNTSERGGKTLYRAANYPESSVTSYLGDVALVADGQVRWQRGADHRLSYGELPNFRYGSFGPFERRPARKRVVVAVDQAGKSTLGVLDELERLGVVGRWQPAQSEGTGYFGTSTDAEPSLPAYTWGTQVWWEMLAAEGVLYLREGDTVTFAPHAVRGFLAAERHFNTLSESLVRLHAFAVGTPVSSGTRGVERLE